MRDQEETRQAMLFLGHYDINQIEIFTSSVTKLVLLLEQDHINQADIFNSPHH